MSCYPPRTRPASPLAAVATLAGLLLAPFAATAAHAESTTHVVQSGETLWDIASSAGVDPNTLAHANDITLDDVLLVGQSITVPDGSSPASPRAPSATPSPKPAAASAPVAPGGRYTVAAGDTVWSIAQSLGTTVRRARAGEQPVRPGQRARRRHARRPGQLARAAVAVAPPRHRPRLAADRRAGEQPGEARQRGAHAHHPGRRDAARHRRPGARQSDAR